MGGLLQFLIRVRFLLLFLALEAVCFFLIISANFFQQTLYISSSNAAVAKVMAFTDAVNGYFHLEEVNKRLAAENAELNRLLREQKATNELLLLDSTRHSLSAAFALDTLKKDTLRIKQYQFTVAKVINNTMNRQNNYLTIDKGSKDGIRAGMGVISPTGIVGKVKLVSEHFATITSLLHRDMRVSASIKKSGASGTIVWEGANPKKARLMYIARHLKPMVGDTVLTSEFSSVFPSGAFVGKISKVDIQDNDTFYDIEVDLSVDLSTVQFVYIIKNSFKIEQDSLQKLTDPTFNE